MLSQFYLNTIIKNPKSVFIILLIVLFSFGYHSKDFRLDASSETLLIDGDPDLKYLQEISERYGSKEFLILTYTPNEGMVTESSINNLPSHSQSDLKHKVYRSIGLLVSILYFLIASLAYFEAMSCSLASTLNPYVTICSLSTSKNFLRFFLVSLLPNPSVPKE